MAAKPKRSHGRGSILLRPDTGFYSYVWTDANGKRHRKSLHTKSRKEALAQAAELEDATKAKDKESVLLESARLRRIINHQPLPLADVWKRFTDTKPTGSPGTLKNYLHSFDSFIGWVKVNRPGIDTLNDVNEDTARDFMAHEWERGITANRHNYIRGALMLITSKVGPRIGIQANPWESVERRADNRHQKQRRRKLTADQAKLLLEHATDPDVHLLVELGMFAGMRLKDAVLLRWQDVDLLDGSIRYIPHKTRGKAIEAHVPIVPELLDELKTRRMADPDGDYVLPHSALLYAGDKEARRKANPDGVQKPLVELIQQVTGDGRRKLRDGDPQRLVNRAAYGYHSLRHTFCSELAAKGIPLALLGKMTGDTAQTLSAFYVDVDPDQGALNGALGALLQDEAPAQITEGEEGKRTRAVELCASVDIETVLRALEILEGSK